MKTKKTTKQAVKKPVKKTAPLSKMTAAQKRVAIAKDAIKQINAGKYIAESMMYCSLDDESGDDIVSDAPNKLDARKVVRQAKSCHVCGVGSLFLSAIDKFNKVNVVDAFGAIQYGERYPTVDDGVGGRTTTYHQYLRRFFSAKQIGLIECYFEGWSFHRPEAAAKYGSPEAVMFRDSHREDDERLLTILKNIVKNKGTFKPEQL